MDENEIRRFFNASNPAKTLDMEDPVDREYYIDFSSVRGGEILKELKRTITLSDGPSCQLFTGHRGCGKSTELLRLKSELEQVGFHTVYFESSEELDIMDVDVSDILLAIARRISESLKSININLEPGYFKKLFAEIGDVLQTPIDLAVGTELSVGIAKITTQTRESPKLRDKLREYLEPRTKNLLESLNEEFLEKAKDRLKQRGKEGLVVIVDNLDRVDPRTMSMGIPQTEYLFINRGTQLRGLECHVVYTIPLELTFSDKIATLVNHTGGGVSSEILPMVSVKLPNNNLYDKGISKLKEMILARAFPNIDRGNRISLISEVFDDSKTLERMCVISGGHIRTLLGILFDCLKMQDPPIQYKSLEKAVTERREGLRRSVKEYEWSLLRQVSLHKKLSREPEYQSLLRRMLVFEYRNGRGHSWFDVNPILLESEENELWMT